MIEERRVHRLANYIIASETDAGILIEENITFNGQMTNDGMIIGGNGNGYIFNDSCCVSRMEVNNKI